MLNKYHLFALFDHITIGHTVRLAHKPNLKGSPSSDWPALASLNEIAFVEKELNDKAEPCRSWVNWFAGQRRLKLTSARPIAENRLTAGQNSRSSNF
jgi:hypothetical protein